MVWTSDKLVLCKRTRRGHEICWQFETNNVIKILYTPYIPDTSVHLARVINAQEHVWRSGLVEVGLSGWVFFKARLNLH